MSEIALSEFDGEKFDTDEEEESVNSRVKLVLSGENKSCTEGDLKELTARTGWSSLLQLKLQQLGKRKRGVSKTKNEIAGQ